MQPADDPCVSLLIALAGGTILRVDEYSISVCLQAIRGWTRQGKTHTASLPAALADCREDWCLLNLPVMLGAAGCCSACSHSALHRRHQTQLAAKMQLEQGLGARRSDAMCPNTPPNQRRLHCVCCVAPSWQPGLICMKDLGPGGVSFSPKHRAAVGIKPWRRIARPRSAPPQTIFTRLEVSCTGRPPRPLPGPGSKSSPPEQLGSSAQVPPPQQEGLNRSDDQQAAHPHRQVQLDEAIDGGEGMLHRDALLQAQSPPSGHAELEGLRLGCRPQHGIVQDRPCI